MALVTNRVQAIVAALQATRDAWPMFTDAAYTVLATQIVRALTPVSFGAGPPTEPGIPVSNVGDLYCDNSSGNYYEYTGAGGWVTFGTGSAPPPSSPPDFDLADDAQGQSPYGYREISGGVFPTAIRWWTDASKTIKTLEQLITRDANQNATKVIWKFYSGGSLVRTITDTVIYSGVTETSRTRSVA